MMNSIKVKIQFYRYNYKHHQLLFSHRDENPLVTTFLRISAMYEFRFYSNKNQK